MLIIESIAFVYDMNLQYFDFALIYWTVHKMNEYSSDTVLKIHVQ